MRHIFVSGHLDLTNDEFVEHYVPRLLEACKGEERAVFHIGDARGADTMAQEFLAEWRAWVFVYHMHEKPRNHVDKQARLVGGFTSDGARDAAMTAATTEDIAWVRPGREQSGTARNLARRGAPRA